MSEKTKKKRSLQGGTNRRNVWLLIVTTLLLIASVQGWLGLVDRLVTGLVWVG